MAAGAEPPNWWASIDRRRAALAVGMSMLALPVVLIDNRPDRSSAEAEEVTVLADVTTTTAAATTAPPLHVEASRLVTSEPARAVVVIQPAIVAAPVTVAPPTTAPPPPPPPTTTTTAPPPPPPPPPPAPPAAPANTESGGATWYRHAPGECAHKTLPRGTVVTVTNHANGASATCTVTDRGPYGGGRIIDLDTTVFEQLAPLDAGVIQVTISW